MTFWIIFQVIINIALIALGLVVWARVSRPQKDDPRLSRGLQLLQSKIAILEDLSDRTDVQVKQLTQLLEQKAKDVEQKISQTEDQLLKVEQSIQKSLEVSKIFQDKIPHKEIIERQNTLKYIQAARLAHQGLTAEEIAEKIDVPMSELEFIVKVNKNKLMFSEEHLPQWAQDGLNLFEVPSNNSAEPEPVIQPALARSLNQSFENQVRTAAQVEEISKIEHEFKKAVEENSPVTNSDEAEISSETIPAIDTGAIEIGLEGDLTTSDLKSSIQKAKELISKTMDKAFDVKSTVEQKVPTQAEFKEAVKNSRIIKKKSDEAKKIKPYEFKKIEL